MNSVVNSPQSPSIEWLVGVGGYQNPFHSIPHRPTDGFITFRLLIFLPAFLHTFSLTSPTNTFNQCKASFGFSSSILFSNKFCVHFFSFLIFLFCFVGFDFIGSVLLLLLEMTLDSLFPSHNFIVCLFFEVSLFISEQRKSLSPFPLLSPSLDFVP